MYAIRARFDGENVVLPEELRGLPAGDVIIVFADGAERLEKDSWQKAQESSFAEAWDNPEDAAYDDL